MAEKRYQVFISSTYDDLKDQRFQILRALLKDGDYIPVGMESFPASGDDQFECIKEYIDASDYYIVIIAGRYGTPTSDGVSYTEKEFDYAEAKLGKKYVLAFPKRNPTYEEENIQKLVDFRTRAIKGRGANFWDNDSEPTSNILNTLKYAVRHDTRPNAGWIRACEAPTETELAKQLQAARDKLQQAEQERDGYRHRVDQLAGALQKLYAERDLIQKTMIIAQKTADDLAAPAKSRPAVGSTYHFGNYDWRVLEVRDGKALLITKEVIDEKPYNEKWKGVTWETCTLRGYLNGEFYESFSEADRAKIVETTVKTPDSGYTAADGTTWSAPGGNETKDHIFLLSIEEVKKYFPMTEVDTLQWGKDHGWTWNKTPWADAWEEAKHYEPAKSPQSDSLIARYQENAHWQWLRSLGDDPLDAAYVSADGSVDFGGFHVGDGSVGVRPALWLNLES